MLANVLQRSASILSTPWETRFISTATSEFAKEHYLIPFGIVSVYVLLAFGGSRIMQDRKAFDLRLPLGFWNAALCIFSFIGMCRTVPVLFASILSRPYEQTVCANPLAVYGTGTVGFWVMLFIFSKIPELVDTAFIVLRKKPLIFLHWYHHITVLLFCWNSYATASGAGLYFVAMNYTVHALMYGYYCLQAFGVCPRSFPAVLITIAQIAQMFVGTGVCISTWYFKFFGTSTCHNDMSNMVAGALMYGSYLYLFVEFAVGRYVKKPVKAVKVL